MRSKSTSYSQNPQQKVIFFSSSYIFVFVSSRRHRLQMANDADEVLLGKPIKNPRKMYGKNCNLNENVESWVRLPGQHRH